MRMLTNILKKILHWLLISQIDDVSFRVEELVFC